ncbi:TonB-dependent receptor [Ferruginibacter sp.]
MKLFFSALLCSGSIMCLAQTPKKTADTVYLQPVEVNAVRASERAPFAKSTLLKSDIQKINLGQDLPVLLNQTPSVVVNSDAGAGVGYTGLRIRGTDGSRINVTLNGIPYNDAESQGSYFVDLPDFSSSINSIQVQRGVGTSSNGAGAFGASINLSTNDINKKFYTELNNSYGSFNTTKNTLQFGSGILGNHFTIDGRLSHIGSDGYIDRAKSNLKSFYFSTAYLDDKNSLRLNIFSGKEKTYQAWNGVPEYLLATNRTYNSAGTAKTGEPYDNETDNYTQTHYQLFYNRKINDYWKGNIAIFLTRGKGYYEQYKADAQLADYGLPDYNNGSSTISSTDLVRRLWLDNNFYGTVFSAQYHKAKTDLTIGGGLNQYDGKHYGEIVWAKVQAAVPANYRWYNLMAHKKDLSFYSKWTQQWTATLQTYADIQYRYINYAIDGFEHNPGLLVKNNYNFVNPKLGITYTKSNWQLYASYALAQHEPNRDDFEAGTTQQPKPELLNDFEAGIERKKSNYSFGINLYYMKYNDQLILTGKINDVGSYTRTNVPNSYRTGIELQGRYIFTKWLNVAANATFSSNKIKNFTEYLDEYNASWDWTGQTSNFYASTNIAFSPNTIAGGSVNITPVKNAEINLLSKYVSRQYLDNTGLKSRSLNSYYTQDIRLSYLLEGNTFKSTSLIVQLNNIFSKKYEPNGYSFSYLYDGSLTTENYYFPMAPFNWMVGLNVRF